MRLAQIVSAEGDRQVVASSGDGTARVVRGATSVRDLALAAIEAGIGLAALVGKKGLDGTVDLAAACAAHRVLPPLDHPDPAHCVVTGTGLTHLGSAEGRDAMHRKLAEAEQLTDSMKMFRMGLEGGKPAAGGEGVQPEWFYKGDGSVLVPPEGDLASPVFARDGGEEPEITGLYVIAPDGSPWRVGYALGNEFSDHLTERENYLWLAHSKLRACAVGPELLLGALPEDVRGTSRIRRGNSVLWEKPFVSGEANMSHAIGNLEHHHFKYRLFRRPGDVHVHFFGTATLSFSDDIRTEQGDIFEIEAAPFGLPLRNRLAQERGGDAEVRVL